MQRYKRKEKNLTAPYSVSNTNTNKCPHGFPVGTCPMCAGMAGGVPKDRNKPRKAGEMSYNECMAEWRRIQAQQKAELQEKAQANRERISELFSQKPLINIEKVVQLQNKIMQSIEKFPPVIKIPAKLALNIIHSTINIVINTINAAYKFVVNIGQNLLNMINSVAEKLPMVLAEMKNYTSKIFEKSLKFAKKIILTLFINNGNQKNKNENDKEGRKNKKLIEKIFGFYLKIKNDNKKQSKQHKQ